MPKNFGARVTFGEKTTERKTMSLENAITEALENMPQIDTLDITQLMHKIPNLPIDDEFLKYHADDAFVIIEAISDKAVFWSTNGPCFNVWAWDGKHLDTIGMMLDVGAENIYHRYTKT